MDIIENIGTNETSYEIGLNENELEALSSILKLAVLMNDELREGEKMLLPATAIYTNVLIRSFDNALRTSRM